MLAKTGIEVLGTPPAEMATELKSAHDYWSKIIPELEIRLD